MRLHAAFYSSLAPAPASTILTWQRGRQARKLNAKRPFAILCCSVGGQTVVFISNAECGNAGSGESQGAADCLVA